MSDHLNDNYVFFKFRKIDKNLLNSLVLSEIYFARPDRLNDPFDCRVDILNALENAISRSPYPLRGGLERLRGMNRLFEKVKTDLENFGICSFSFELKELGKVLNKVLLWSHYADNHRGICLIYCFPESYFTPNQIFWFAQVNYEINPLSDWFIEWTHSPNSDNYEEFVIQLILKILTVKAKPWEYENEVRIIRKTDGVQVIDKSYLKQVCFGLQTPESDITLVRKLLDCHGYDVAFCRMTRSAGSDFGVEPVDV